MRKKKVSPCNKYPSFLTIDITPQTNDFEGEISEANRNVFLQLSKCVTVEDFRRTWLLNY